MQELSENNKQILLYLKRHAAKRLLNPGRPSELYDAFVAYMTDRLEVGVPSDESFQSFAKKLAEGSSRIGMVFQKTGASRFLHMILPKEKVSQIKSIWERSVDYPYSTGYDRRPFRSRANLLLPLGACIECLAQLVMLQVRDISLPDVLAGKWNLTGYHRVVSSLIALELDQGNEKIFDQIQEIVNGQAARGTVTREIIHGLLMSHDRRAHKLVGDLFLAAKLQEGLRQAVVESMDEGCRESFLYFLHLILDHDMLRFSSVVRALDVWTGLGIQVEKPSLVKKCLEAGLACLEDKTKIDEYIKSKDNILIYMGLWATAFDEANDLVAPIKRLLASGERHKRLCALYFLRQTQLPHFQRITAEPLLDENDHEIVAWAVENLFVYKNINSLLYCDPRREPVIRGKADATTAKTFSMLLPLAKRLSKPDMKFEASAFPWGYVTLSASAVLDKMMIAIIGSANDSQIDELARLMGKMSPIERQVFIRCFLKKYSTPLQKETIVKAMGDKSESVRDAANEIIAKIQLSNEDYRYIESLLDLRSGDLRQNAMSVLLKMPTTELLGCIERLAQSGDENKRLAAIELVQEMEKVDKHRQSFAAASTLVSVMPVTTQKQRMHATRLTVPKPEIQNKANGFGLFDPKRHYTPPPLTPVSQATIRHFMFSNEAQAKRLLQELSEVLEKYKDFEYEFEGWNGVREKRLIGNGSWLSPVYGKGNGQRIVELGALPLSEVWTEIYSHYSSEQILFARLSLQETHSLGHTNLQWFNDLLNALFPMKVLQAIKEFSEKLPHYAAIYGLLMDFEQTIGPKAFAIASEVCRHLYVNVPPEYYVELYNVTMGNIITYGGLKPFLTNSPYFRFWLELLRSSVHDDATFAEYFNIAYLFYISSQFEAGPLTLSDFGRAFHLGLIDQNEVFAQLMGRPGSSAMIAVASDSRGPQHRQAAAWPELTILAEKAVDFIARTETRRGELPTEVSSLAAKVYKCYGIDNFVSILLNAEKDTYVRGYDFVGDDSTKRNMLSHLLRCLYPRPGEDEKTLGALLQERRVSEKQLVDAAMYSPQWIDIVEKYLGWEGLKSACWYFHAHLNDRYSDEKTAIVARFSPIEPQDFKDGAFDINWFRDAYSALGPARFRLVYDSAKYISGGSLHKRSQLFADAVTGKLDLSDLETQLEATRNKDRLLAYSLIPQTGMEDVLRRYHFIQLFAKQAKQFGAQRQASETLAARIALENLARNAGYSDANRLTWRMETENLDQVRDFFSAKLVEDITVSISLDDKGIPSLLLQKDGQGLKDLPARLKKNEYIDEAKAVLKQLRDQHQRARASLEAAMVNGDRFTASELTGLEKNPVLAPMLHALVFQCEEHFGLLADEKLIAASGEAHLINNESSLEIAHPVQLYRNGVWPEYQKLLFDRQLVQPFKQVFRELYLPNEDELSEGTISRRYAGHQVQPKKAVALLKTKGWTASPEEGLQKVLHKQNVVVEILAMADWFSPSDVENPTIEVVRFMNRKTGEPLQIGELPPTLFSEAMRDVDLAVSVAHAGGVDPEASLSTVEMRTAIVANLLPLMRLTNVRLQGSHALILGHFGEYSVHLGSGIVHMMARGAINILPVHSQHRGRIFLPFIDDDPKTAEILSKIVLLAEDKMIKDPSILVQIKYK